MEVALSVFIACATVLAGLVLVLRFLDRREMRKQASVAASVEGEFREKLKVVDGRLSKLELKAVR